MTIIRAMLIVFVSIGLTCCHALGQPEPLFSPISVTPMGEPPIPTQLISPSALTHTIVSTPLAPPLSTNQITPASTRLAALLPGQILALRRTLTPSVYSILRISHGITETLPITTTARTAVVSIDGRSLITGQILEQRLTSKLDTISFVEFPFDTQQRTRVPLSCDTLNCEQLLLAPKSTMAALNVNTSLPGRYVIITDTSHLQEAVDSSAIDIPLMDESVALTWLDSKRLLITRGGQFYVRTSTGQDTSLPLDGVILPNGHIVEGRRTTTYHIYHTTTDAWEAVQLPPLPRQRKITQMVLSPDRQYMLRVQNPYSEMPQCIELFEIAHMDAKPTCIAEGFYIVAWLPDP